MTPQVITFHYQLKDEAGQILDTSHGGDPLDFLEGARQIISGLEEGLLKLQKGDKQEIFVPYKDGYGAYDSALVSQAPRNNFPAEPIKTGDMFQIEREGRFQIVTVVEVTEQMVTLDANHPLAGKDLVFLVEVMDKRDATSEEINHGHTHGPGGHHH